MLQYNYEIMNNGTLVLSSNFAIVTGPNGVSYNTTETEVSVIRPQLAGIFLKNAVRKAEIPLEQLVDAPLSVFTSIKKVIGDPAEYHKRHQALVDLWTVRFQIAAL
jgi:hypothetical protein